MNRPKALVTGGAGFIGSNLVDMLLSENWEVLVVDDLSTGLRENLNATARLEELSIVEDRLRSVFAAWRPSHVFHLAAQANVRVSLDEPLRDTEVNAQGTLNVLEACRHCGVKKIIFSSTGGAIYGEPRQIPCTEDHPRLPLSLYGANKLVAEHYIDVYRHSYGLDYSIFRFANVYGPRQNPKGEAGVVAIFSQLMLTGGQPVIFGDGTKTRDYVHVSDIISALRIGIKSASGCIYNVGTGFEISDRTVFDTIAENVEFTDEPRFSEYRAGEVYRIALDAGRLRREHGWAPKYDFRAGIRQTVPWYRERVKAGA